MSHPVTTPWCARKPQSIHRDEGRCQLHWDCPPIQCRKLRFKCNDSRAPLAVIQSNSTDQRIEINENQRWRCRIARDTRSPPDPHAPIASPKPDPHAVQSRDVLRSPTLALPRGFPHIAEEHAVETTSYRLWLPQATGADTRSRNCLTRRTSHGVD
jgi:hypothetical protein